MSDAHLQPLFAIVGVLQQEIRAAAAEAIPYVLDLGRDGDGGPIGVAEIGDHGSQLRQLGIDIFGRGFDPVILVDTQDQTALVILVLGLEAHAGG